MTSKFRAVPTYYCSHSRKISSKRLTRFDLRFDSKFEAQVYAKLRELVPATRIERQVPLLIKPETIVYRPCFWKCDFRIRHHSHNSKYWNIEAKGFLTREFLRNLEYLQLYSLSDWSRLLIVTSNTSLKVRHFTPFSLNQLERFLTETNFVER